MTRCANCNTEWTAQTKIKGSMTLDRYITCPSCGNKQYITKRYSRNTGILRFITLAVILMMPVFLDVNFTAVAVVGVILMLINLWYCYYAFSVSNTDETMDAFTERFKKYDRS